MRNRAKGVVGLARRGGRWAFTLTELLVVVLIIAAIMVIAVPSFSSLMYSSEATMAENLVQVSLRGGRDAALRSASGEDGAVVFFYEPAPGGGRLVMTPCVKVGAIFDLPPNLPAAVWREIFVPVGTVESVQLPKHWMVRGYAPANSIENPAGWYEGTRYGNGGSKGDWVFPETGFFTPAVVDEGRFRQTFMVRFQSGSGVVVAATGAAPLVFAPAQAAPTAFGGINAGEATELKTLRLSNPRKYVERVLGSHTVTATSKRALLGASSADMVMVRPVSVLALYDETRLASAIGGKLDPDTGCLYQKHMNGQNPAFAPIYDASGNIVRDNVRIGRMMNRWIEGDTNQNDRIDSREMGDEPEARLFTIDRYTGVPKRMETQQ